KLVARFAPHHLFLHPQRPKEPLHLHRGDERRPARSPAHHEQRRPLLGTAPELGRAMSESIIVQNRVARRNYEILDTFEAGVVLVGTEVKSLREAGSMTLKDSFADIRANGEIFLVGAHIQPYKQGNIYNHEPERARKL